MNEIDLDDTKSVNKSAFFHIICDDCEELSSELWIKNTIEKHEINIHESGCGWDTTLLHIACIRGHVVLVKTLLKLGASKYTVNKWGNTPTSDVCISACSTNATRKNKKEILYLLNNPPSTYLEIERHNYLVTMKKILESPQGKITCPLCEYHDYIPKIKNHIKDPKGHNIINPEEYSKIIYEIDEKSKNKITVYSGLPEMVFVSWLL